MAVESWPRPNNEAAESWREVGPVARVYIGTLGGDDRPKSRAQPQPPPPEPSPEELEATQNFEPIGNSSIWSYPDRGDGRPDDTPGSGDGPQSQD